MSYFIAIKFLLTCLRQKALPTPDRTILLPLQSGIELESDIYEPDKSKPCHGTILFFHGMNKLGKNDERMMKLAYATAKIGFRAIVPTFPLVVRHIVDKQSVINCAEAIKTIVADKALCEHDALGIFTASFSGSASIRAITQVEGIAPLVSSLCSVGICFHPDSTFENILNAKEADKYAKYIAVKALLRATGELNEELEQAIDLAIDKEYEESSGEELQAFLAQASPDTQKRMVKLIDDLEQQRKIADDYRYCLPFIEKDFEVKNLDRLQCSTTLIHSAEDSVLPTLESKLLYQAIRQARRPARLLITPVLDHADVVLTPRYFIEVLKLIRAFHYFFAHI